MKWGYRLLSTTYNVKDADVGAAEEADDTETDQEHVFPKDPVVTAETVGPVPERDSFDDSREDETKERETHCAYQRYERTEVGNRDGYAQGQDNDSNPDAVLGKIFFSSEPVADVLPNDLHRYVELKAVRKEDGDGDHQFHTLAQPGKK